MSASIATDAEVLGFTEVPSVSMTVSEMLLKERRIAESVSKVALLYKGLDVYVSDLRLDGAEFLLGHVSDFSNICSTQYEGLKLGLQISFRFRHIHQICEG